MLTACGNKTETSINPLGGVHSATTATETSSETTYTQTTTRPAEKVSRNLKKEVFIDVPYYSQKDYPTGCELVSTSMLLAFYGFDIKAGDIIEQGYMEAVDVTEVEENGMIVKYSGDPDKVFIGNPSHDTGYGCHSGAVMKALRKYLVPKSRELNTKYEVTNLTGMKLEEICEKYISREIPVLVWASIDMNPTFNRLGNSWIIEDTDERYFWKSNEHCLVLVGYDEENYYFNDPLVGKDTPYMKRLAERRHGEMGMQAIAVEEVSP